jgi:hypothetical protein
MAAALEDLRWEMKVAPSMRAQSAAARHSLAPSSSTRHHQQQNHQLHTGKTRLLSQTPSKSSSSHVPLPGNSSTGASNLRSPRLSAGGSTLFGPLDPTATLQAAMVVKSLSPSQSMTAAATAGPGTAKQPSSPPSPDAAGPAKVRRRSSLLTRDWRQPGVWREQDAATA